VLPQNVQAVRRFGQMMFVRPSTEISMGRLRGCRRSVEARRQHGPSEIVTFRLTPVGRPTRAAARASLRIIDSDIRASTYNAPVYGPVPGASKTTGGL